MRAEAPPCGGSQTLAPLASARKQHSADRSRACELKQRALFLNRANAACGSEPGDSRSDDPPCRETAARATLRIAKPQNDKYQRSNNRKRTTIPNPPAPLRRQRTAESTNHADANHDPHHSGCEVAGSEDKTKIIHTENRPNRMAPESGPKPECKERQDRKSVV